MARTTRYGAMMRHRRVIKNRTAQEAQVKVVMQRWIKEVVVAGRLCPFAAKQKVEIVVVADHLGRHVEQSKRMEQLRGAVQTKAKELVDVVKGAPMRSVFLVFPYQNDVSIDALYKTVLEQSNGLLGGIDDRTPANEYMKVQAFPFEGQLDYLNYFPEDDNHLFSADDVSPTMLTAMAPWNAIQLICYSDLAKIPNGLRLKIMERNDVANSDEEFKLQVLRAFATMVGETETPKEVASPMVANVIHKGDKRVFQEQEQVEGPAARTRSKKEIHN